MHPGLEKPLELGLLCVDQSSSFTDVCCNLSEAITLDVAAQWYLRIRILLVALLFDHRPVTSLAQSDHQQHHVFNLLSVSLVVRCEGASTA